MWHRNNSSVLHSCGSHVSVFVVLLFKGKLGIKSVRDFFVFIFI